MIDYKGIWLPDAERHLQQWMDKVGKFVDGKPTYQYHKYAAAVQYAKQRRVAVDIGAHVGLWTRVMALDFSAVVCFEPMLEHIACWKKNLSGIPSAFLHECALGDHDGTVRLTLRTPGSTGDRGVDPDAERSSLRASVSEDGQDAVLKRLDDFHLEHIDFLKADCEGYELFVMRGGEETLKRCRPALIVEQKPETGGYQRYGIGVTDAVKYLESLGAKQRQIIQGDYIMSWD